MVRGSCWQVRGAFAIAIFAAGTFIAAKWAGSPPVHAGYRTAPPALAAAHNARSPLVFEENRGQDEPTTLFLGRFGGSTAQFRADEVRFPHPSSDAAPSRPARIALANANQAPVVRGHEPQASYTNYYRGNDPNEWLTGIPHYASVVYEQVYPGIDWVWYGNQGRLEYDFRVSPGADPQQARLQFGEEDALTLDANGDLVITAEGRESRYLRPVVYQQAAAGRQPVAGEYVLLAENRVGFALGDYDASRELVIDPVLFYSGYFGDARLEEAPSVVVDPSGSAFLAAKSANDVVVFKLQPDGAGVDFTLVLAGSSTDATACQGSAIALDAGGNIFVTGETTSSNFPTTAGAYSTTRAGSGDIFITRLSPDGTMSYSTFLGGAGSDSDPCIALGPDGDVYIAAETDSEDFPTTDGAYDRQFELLIDLTVSRLRLNAQGANDLIYSTYIGGLCNDRDPDLVVGPDGMIYVVAESGLPDSFPTTPGAFDSTHNGEIDIVFFKLNPAGQGHQDLMYSTYFGGSGWDERFANGKGIALDRAGNVYIAGDTDSENTPLPTTAGAFDRTFNGEWDIFVAKFSPNMEGRFDLAFSTLFGGSGIEDSAGIVVDDAGLIYFSGSTDSEDVPLPLVNPTQAEFGGGQFDAFVGALSPDGSQLLFSTYFGGSTFDCCPDLFVDDNGGVTVAGETNSLNLTTTPNVPATGPFRRTFAGALDVFVSRFEQLGIRMVTNSNATNIRPRFAPETIASGYGVGLAGQTLLATEVPLPQILAGVVVRVVDSNGISRPAGLFFVSEFQINYLIPAGTALGWARVEVVRDGQIVARDGLEITAVSPGVYTANGTGSGAPAANFLLVKAGGARLGGPVFDGNAPLGQRMPIAVDMGEQGDELFVTFFTTGTRGATTVTATVNGVAVPATKPFALEQYAGLEQVNLGPFPRSLVGSGVVEVAFIVDGVPANVVQIELQ